MRLSDLVSPEGDDLPPGVSLPKAMNELEQRRKLQHEMQKRIKERKAIAAATFDDEERNKKLRRLQEAEELLTRGDFHD